jgi:transposase
MIYVGIDVHKTRSTLVALDPSTGEFDETTVHTDRDELVEALSKLPEPFVVGVEATLFSPAVTTWLTDAGFDVRLLDPQALLDCDTRKRAKTDRVDAMMMAKAMAHGHDVECYLAEDDVLQLRALTRGRETISKMSTMLRNKLRSILFQCGIVLQLSDLRGKAAAEQVPELIESLPGNIAVMAATFWNLLIEVEQALKTTDDQIKEEVKQHPVASRVADMSGAGPITALTIVAEIGRIDRFPSCKNLFSFGGLVPTTHQSGDTQFPGELPQQCNKRLRWAAVMAAQGAARCRAPNKAKSHYQQVKRRCGPNTAKIAAARKILVDVYFIWWQVIG